MPDRWSTIDINSAVDGDYQVKINRYESLEELLEELEGCPLDDIKEFGGYDGDGKEWVFSPKDMVATIKKMGCYGFARDKKEIHVWIDKNTVDMQDLIAMLAHEKGHLVRPFRRDPMKEEIKADRYGDAAAFAFSAALDLLKETKNG